MSAHTNTHKHTCLLSYFTKIGQITSSCSHYIQSLSLFVLSSCNPVLSFLSSLVFFSKFSTLYYFSLLNSFIALHLIFGTSVLVWCLWTLSVAVFVFHGTDECEWNDRLDFKTPLDWLISWLNFDQSNNSLFMFSSSTLIQRSNTDSVCGC